MPTFKIHSGDALPCAENMKPFFIDEQAGIQIYCCDARELLPELSAIPLCVTSPPYNKMGFEGFKRTRHHTDSWSARNVEYGDFDDFMPEDEYQEWQIDVLTMLSKSLCEGGSVFYNHKVRVRDYVCSFPTNWLQRTPLKIRQEIVWDRCSSPSVNPIRFYPTTEKIYWLFKGDRPRYFNPDSAIYKEVWAIQPKADPDHPAPFPFELAARCIIACSRRDEVVLDPFGGSGTTMLAAKSLGRCGIMCELEERYCEVAANRLRQAVFNFEPQVQASSPQTLFT